MKNNKKLLTMLSAAMLMTAPAALISNSNQAHAAQTTDQQADTNQGMLTLNHNTRVYNKNGQKLYSYQRNNGLLKKSATVKYAKSTQAITDPSTVRYSFHDDDWNWFYLPYKTIKGQEYYSIGHGGYIKAVNVQQINGKYLYTNKASLKIDKSYSNGVQVMDSKGKSKNKKLNPGQKVMFDRSASNIDFYGNNTDGNGDSKNYRIAGSDEFVSMDSDVLRQQLLPYSNYMNVYLTKDTNVYTDNGEQYVPTANKNEILLGVNKNSSVESTREPEVLPKGRIESVIKEVNIKLPNENKAELFYQLQSTNDSVAKFVKAADVKYAYGQHLQVTDLATK
ncbi:SLAP domain-containing protein [Lactobacillus sp. ESL0785]|uniref:SLAP domain-containing protein n=1 Tax=Lactobacillus sp. ESL0785 TaxID=2983232 RepID=UPI0023F897F9|nr:SLAP domain-containing protein [Lactobacillus sp. ESL0785]WEV70440.1 SLAP domain-containing protein [Lactobacillus sp. ESL0785]